ncbi:hypothetical protein [Brachybacterium sp. GPGPB12]|uniref:hypothetical protein n=1 Tax=Brachybacterium sp. GPGPB12 TaxID=3023517 RepID=UPI0031343CB0
MRPHDVVHGDFYEAQVFVQDGRVVGLLDIDTVGPGRRADDLACLLAHLSVLADYGNAGRIDRGMQQRVEDAIRTWHETFQERVDPVELARAPQGSCSRSRPGRTVSRRRPGRPRPRRSCAWPRSGSPRHGTRSGASGGPPRRAPRRPPPANRSPSDLVRPRGRKTPRSPFRRRGRRACGRSLPRVCTCRAVPGSLPRRAPRRCTSPLRRALGTLAVGAPPVGPAPVGTAALGAGAPVGTGSAVGTTAPLSAAAVGPAPVGTGSAFGTPAAVDRAAVRRPAAAVRRTGPADGADAPVPPQAAPQQSAPPQAPSQPSAPPTDRPSEAVDQHPEDDSPTQERRISSSPPR